METFKAHTYPDVLISVLIKSLREFKLWLDQAATAKSSRKSFWQRLFGASPTRPPLKGEGVQALSIRIEGLATQLEKQLTLPESANKRVKRTHGTEISGKATIGAEVVSPVGKGSSALEAAGRSSDEFEEQSEYTSHKIEYLHQHIMTFQKLFKDLAELSSGPSFLVLDDRYHIRKADQPRVIDYFHRVAKGNQLWLKIRTIKHRSEWYVHGNPPVGLKLGDDANEIDLDLTLEKYQTCKAFLTKLLAQLVDEATRVSLKNLIIDSAIDRLVIASGGVARDFIGIFGRSIRIARDRGESHHRGPKVGVEDVNLSAGEYDANKREEFKVDSASDRTDLETQFDEIVEFCTRTAKCNVFLVDKTASGEGKDNLNQQIDLRLVHLVKSRVSVKKNRPGEAYEAFMLDLSQYTAARKIHDLHLIDLSKSDSAEQIRKASLIYEV